MSEDVTTVLAQARIQPTQDPGVIPAQVAPEDSGVIPEQAGTQCLESSGNDTAPPPSRG